MAISKMLCERGDDYGPAIIGREIREHAPEIIKRGQRQKFDEDGIAEIRKMYDSGMSVNVIAEKVGASFDTVKPLIGEDFEYRYHKKAMSCPDVEKLREMAESSDFGMADIYTYFNTTSSRMIHRWFEEHNITQVKQVHPSRLDDEVLKRLKDKEWMQQAYLEHGTVGVGEILGVTDGTVGRYLEQLGINRDKVFSCSVSEPEKELGDFVESLGFEITHNSRSIIPPNELDIYVPDKDIAFEYNGLYWHSEARKGKSYHHDKYRACVERGIQLIQIWEDDWLPKNRSKTESLISHKLGVSSLPKIGARKCTVELVSKEESDEFFALHHSQGPPGISSVRIGLRYCGDLVACMTFRRKGSEYTLSRFATSVIVQGGFSRLLRFFESNYHFSQIVTFADLSVSNGDLYYKNGFILDKIIAPDYSYVVGKHREHKFNYRKERFERDPKLLFQPDISERKLADLNGLDRIYDAGKKRFIKTADI